MANWECTDGIGSHSKAMSESEGVYVIIHIDYVSKTKQVLYIGRSLNLSMRWKSHNIYKKTIQDAFFPAVKWKYCRNSAYLEMNLIKRFQPKYNKQFK